MALSQDMQYLTPSFLDVFAQRTIFLQSQIPGRSPRSTGAADSDSAGKASGSGSGCSRAERPSSSYPADREWKSPMIEIRPPMTMKAVAPSSPPPARVTTAITQAIAAKTWYVTINSTKRAIARAAWVVRRASFRSSSCGLSTLAMAVLSLPVHRVTTNRKSTRSPLAKHCRRGAPRVGRWTLPSPRREGRRGAVGRNLCKTQGFTPINQ